MCVFGFGRADLKCHLTEVPRHFAIGFVDSKDFNTVKTAVENVYDGNPPEGPVTIAENNASAVSAGITGLSTTMRNGALSIQAPFSGEYQVKIFDIAGKMILSQKALAPSHKLNAPGMLAGGTYLISVQKGAQKLSTHFRCF